MKNGCCCCCGVSLKTIVYAVAILGTFLIMAFLVWEMQKLTRPAAVNQKRVAERLQFKQEVQTAGAKTLTEYAWRDQGKGLVVIPIERAKELLLKEWQDPAAGRKTLVGLAEKAAAPAPEKPSAFE